MMKAPRYIIHQTGYERDGYILKSLLANLSETSPLPNLRRTTWHVCWVALDELNVGQEHSPDQAAVQRLVSSLRMGQPIEPILVLGPEKQLLVGHLNVAALRALGEPRALAYHGEWLDPNRPARPEMRAAAVA